MYILQSDCVLGGCWAWPGGRVGAVSKPDTGLVFRTRVTGKASVFTAVTLPEVYTRVSGGVEHL